MHRTLKILQLNVHKRREVQESLMNDESLKEHVVLAISEPYARRIDDAVVTAPQGHHSWTKFIPTTRRETTWPIRSMLWVRSDIEAEQIPVPSADLTAARIRLPDRDMLIVAVYVEGANDEALERAVRELDQLTPWFRNRTGTRTDVILAGGFNRHDQLWGGDDVSPLRQGEGDPIVNLMDEHSLCSLLPRGTKTWQSGNSESTIDLVLTSVELADQMIKCTIHPCDHGSDHRAIETVFDVAMEDRPTETRFLFKNAPWTEIRARVTENLLSRSLGRHCSTTNGPAHGRGSRGGLQPDAQSEAFTVRQAVVDNRSDTAPKGVHLLEEPGEVPTQDGKQIIRARGASEVCSQGVPRRRSQTKERTLERLPGRRCQHLAGVEIPAIQQLLSGHG